VYFINMAELGRMAAVVVLAEEELPGTK